LKPYLLVPWAFLIAGLLWHAGWKRGLRSPVFWIPPALSALSWLATLAYVPDYLRMAKVASRYYNTLNTNSYIEYFPLVLPAWAACKAFQTKRLLPHLTALAALGFAADSILQAKASAYHMAPALFWSFITFAVLAIENDNPKNIVKGSLALAAYSILALALPAGLPRNTVDDFVTQNARGGTVLALTTYPWTAFPLIFEANAKNARPDAALWTIGGMYRDQVERANQSPDFIPARYHTRAEMSDDERRAFDQVVRIVSDERPEIILVQTTPSKWGLDHLQFNFLDYYSADERFREAIRDYQRGPADGHRQVLFRSVPQLHANRAHRSE
jgi:hypothetical protein